MLTDKENICDILFSYFYLDFLNVYIKLYVNCKKVFFFNVRVKSCDFRQVISGLNNFIFYIL